MPEEAQRRGHEAGAAPRTHAPGRPGGPGGAQLPRLDGRAAVEQQLAGPARPRERAGDPRRGPRPPAGDQGPHPRVPGRAEAARRFPRPDPLLRRPAGSGQDLPRPIDRPRHGARVRADLAGRRAGRGRDPGTPPHLRGSAARSDHPGFQDGGDQQPGLHAGRDRQARSRLPRRSVVVAARGAGSRAELRTSAITTSTSPSISRR